MCWDTQDSITKTVTVYATEAVNDDCNAVVGKGVGVSSGIAVVPETDASIQGVTPLSLTRYHNSKSAYGGTINSFGRSWALAFDTRATAMGMGLYRVAMPDGSVKYYRDENGDGISEAVSPKDDRSSLTRRADGSLARELATGAVESFNAEGYLTGLTDRNGNALVLTRDTSNRLLQVTDPSGRAVQFEYDASGRIMRILLPDSSAVDYSYVNGLLQKVTFADGTSRTYEYSSYMLTGIKNENGKYVKRYTYSTRGATSSSADGLNEKVTLAYTSSGTTTVTDSLGRNKVYATDFSGGKNHLVAVSGAGCTSCGSPGTAFTYDTSGRVTSVKDANGNTTRYWYDAAGNVQAMIEADGTSIARTTSYAYDARGRVLTTWLPGGGVVQNTYDSRGNLLTSTDPGVNRTTYTYDNRGLVTSVTDPTGNTTLFGYDPYGNLVRTENALGHATTLTRDVMGRILVVISGAGTTSYEYDARGRRVRSIAADGGVTQYEYDAAGNTTAVVDPLGARTTYEYDAVGRLRRIADSFGNSMTYGYDTESNLISRVVTNGAGTVTTSDTFAYDEENRPRRVTHADGTYLEYVRDGNGNVLTVIDEGGRAHGFTHDALGQLLSTVDPLGHTSLVAYDEGGGAIRRVDALGIEITYGYDPSRNVTAITSPEAGTTSYQYDSSGGVSVRSDPYGTLVFERDALRRVVRSWYPASGVETRYTYDSCLNGIGRICGVSDASGVTSLEYDVVGRVTKRTSVIAGVSYTTRFGYDLAGRMTTLTYPSGRALVFSYTNGQLTAVHSGASPIVSDLAYMPFGDMTALTYGNGVHETIGYDSRYRLTSMAAGTILNRSYRYDATGNVTGVDDNLAPENGRSFGYDPLNRITSATGPYGAISYAYDPVGNRVTETTPAGATAFIYTGSRLSSASGVKPLSISYDAAGSPVAYNTKQFAYDDGGRLTEVWEGGQAIARYAYGASGQRVRKTTASGSVVYQYDLEGNLLAESTEAGDVTAEYLFLAGRPIARFEGSAVYYFLTDPIGVPQRITDSAGSLVWAAEMLPFGELWTGQGTISNNLRFPGQYYDAETGLHQNWARDYDPSTGRYLEADPLLRSSALAPPTAALVGAHTASVTNLRVLGQYDERSLGSVGLQGPYYNWHRWYLPGVGRYLELEPIALGGGFNGIGWFAPDWYNYGGGNPLTNIDPLGLQAAPCLPGDSTVVCCMKKFPGCPECCGATGPEPPRPPVIPWPPPWWPWKDPQPPNDCSPKKDQDCDCMCVKKTPWGNEGPYPNGKKKDATACKSACQASYGADAYGYCK